MAKDIKAYDLLISCPSDVSEYVKMLEEEVKHFNDRFGQKNDITVRTRHWLKDSYSEFGSKPQELLNKQIVDSSDMAVGVFWTRFGTPTDNYGSGTEEEIEKMLSLGRQVFLYFLEKPRSLSEIDQEQYRKLELFKDKYKNKGIFFAIKDEKDLASKFRDDLECYFYNIIRGEEVKKSSSKKEILWVDDRPENNVYGRKILESYGITFSLALSTQQALDYMEHHEFVLIISDMGRKEGDQEGYVLLEEVRKKDKKIPFIIHASSNKREHVNEALRRGAQGCTNDSNELINLVIKNLLLN